MLRRLRDLFRAPFFPEEDDARRARIVQILSLSIPLAIIVPVAHTIT